MYIVIFFSYHLSFLRFFFELNLSLPFFIVFVCLRSGFWESFFPSSVIKNNRCKRKAKVFTVKMLWRLSTLLWCNVQISVNMFTEWRRRREKGFCDFNMQILKTRVFMLVAGKKYETLTNDLSVFGVLWHEIH